MTSPARVLPLLSFTAVRKASPSSSSRSTTVASRLGRSLALRFTSLLLLAALLPRTLPPVRLPPALSPLTILLLSRSLSLSWRLLDLLSRSPSRLLSLQPTPSPRPVPSLHLDAPAVLVDLASPASRRPPPSPTPSTAPAAAPGLLKRRQPSSRRQAPYFTFSSFSNLSLQSSL